MPISRNRKKKKRNLITLSGRTHEIQLVRSKPLKEFIESYLTVKGLRLKAKGASEIALNKYRKNRYRINPESKVIRTIYHLDSN